MTNQMLNVWSEFLRLKGVPEGRPVTAWDVVALVAAAVHGATMSVAIAASPAAMLVGNKVAEFSRLLAICLAPLVCICYGTLRTRIGSRWWYDRAGEAYCYSVIWFAMPSVGAAAWVADGTATVLAFLAIGLTVHLCVFVDLRRRACRNAQLAHRNPEKVCNRDRIVK
jgi:hypothetical protein